MKYIKNFENSKYKYEDITEFDFSILFFPDSNDKNKVGSKPYELNLRLIFLNKEDKKIVISTLFWCEDNLEYFINGLVSFNKLNNIEILNYGVFYKFEKSHIITFYDSSFDRYDLSDYKDIIDNSKNNKICIALSKDNINIEKLKDAMTKSSEIYNSIKYNI